MKKFLKYLAIIFIANLSFLFSPAPGEDALNNGYHTYIPLNNYMGVTFNGDSYIFIDCAIAPSDLMQQNSFRQARALYVLAGTITGSIIYYGTYPLHGITDTYLKKKNIFQNYNTPTHPGGSTKYLFFYLGYIILNIIILLIAFILFEKIITALSGSWKNGDLLFGMILLMLASNLETRFFFWTPHQQLLNILAPLLCIHLGITFLQYRNRYPKILLIAVALGLLLLVYGNMLLILPVLLGGYLYTEKKQNKQLSFMHAIRSFLITFAFFLPMIGWIVWLKSRGITFYNPELAEYREFVWILDSFGTPIQSVFRTFLSHSFHFLQTFGCLVIPVLFLFIVWLIHKKRTGSTNISRNLNSQFPDASLLLLFVLIETFLFLWMIGYYADRLTFSLVPILLCYSALILNFQKIASKTKYLLIAFIIIFHFYNVFAPLYLSK